MKSANGERRRGKTATESGERVCYLSYQPTNYQCNKIRKKKHQSVSHSPRAGKRHTIQNKVEKGVTTFTRYKSLIPIWVRRILNGKFVLMGRLF